MDKTNKQDKKCSYIKLDGGECEAWAMKDSDYCFTHNPATKEAKLQAVRKGGFNSKKTNLDLPPLNLKTSAEVATLLEETINQVRGGEIPPKYASTIGYLAGYLLRAVESSDIDQRLRSVESVLLGRKTASKERKKW